MYYRYEKQWNKIHRIDKKYIYNWLFTSPCIQGLDNHSSVSSLVKINIRIKNFSNFLNILKKILWNEKNNFIEFLLIILK